MKCSDTFKNVNNFVPITLFHILDFFVHFENGQVRGRWENSFNFSYIYVTQYVFIEYLLCANY